METESYDTITNANLLDQLRFMLHFKSHISPFVSNESTTEVTTPEPPTGDDSNDDWIGYLLSTTAGVAISFGYKIYGFS